MQDPLDSAFSLIQDQLAEKDREIQDLKKENLILQKEYDRVCQMLSIQQREAEKSKGFFSRLFPKKDVSDPDLLTLDLQNEKTPSSFEAPKSPLQEESPRDLCSKALQKVDRDQWPQLFIAYLKEDPEREDVLTLLAENFPENKPQDFQLLLNLLDENLLEDLLKRRPDLALTMDLKSLPGQDLVKALRLYYLEENWALVDRCLHLFHHKKDRLSRRDLKILYLLSLSRPIPLSDDILNRLEDTFQKDQDFQTLARIFKGEETGVNFTQCLAENFSDQKDQHLLCLAYTQR